MIRTIDTAQITSNIKEMCIHANHYLSSDMEDALKNAESTEKSPLGKKILGQLEENLEIADKEVIPICQDTGMAVIFMEIGQDVHFEGENLEDAINEGVRQGYTEGYLRKSVVKDPILRENTKDNTPAIVHYSIVPGDKVKITVAPKGFGSENMSRIFMLKPADGIEGVKEAILTAVRDAGPNACPPMVIGVGVGGDVVEILVFADGKKLLCKFGRVRTVGFVAEHTREAEHGAERRAVVYAVTDDVELVVINGKGVGVDAPVLCKSYRHITDDGKNVGLVLLDICKEVFAIDDVCEIGRGVFIFVNKSLIKKQVGILADNGVIGDGIGTVSGCLYGIESAAIDILFQLLGGAGKFLVKTLQQIVVDVGHQTVVDAEPDYIELILTLVGILQLGHAELVEFGLGHSLLCVGGCLGLLIFDPFGVLRIELRLCHRSIDAFGLCSADGFLELGFRKSLLLFFLDASLHNTFDGAVILVKSGQIKLDLGLEL